MQERGLKQSEEWEPAAQRKSLLMQERGLKLSLYQIQALPDFVAPHAGAWIETSSGS